MNPQYIKLTAVKFTMPPQHRGQPAQTTILQPPVVQLVPLPQALNKAQVDGRTERTDSGVVVTHRELFDDVIAAIEKAHQEGAAIAVPIDRTALAEAAANVSAQKEYFHRTRNAPTIQEAVETAVNGVKAAIEGEEAKNDPRYPDGFPAPTGDGTRDLERIRDHLNATANAPAIGAAVDENAPQWNDFVQTDGESVGAPAYKRRPRVGDLRIHSVEPGRFFLEQAWQREGDADITWAAPQVPFSLLSTFDSRDQLIEEVAKAGKESLLVNA